MDTLPEIVLTWARAFASLSPTEPPCPGLRTEEWRETHRRVTDWIPQWGAQAAGFGWDTLRLFSVHPTSGTLRGDYTGQLLPLIADVTEVNDQFMRIGPWRAFLLMPVKSPGVPIWDFGKTPPDIRSPVTGG